MATVYVCGQCGDEDLETKTGTNYNGDKYVIVSPCSCTKQDVEACEDAAYHIGYENGECDSC